MNQNNISIQEFYRGKSIFITGATGFIGRVLIEKLLRSCPDLDKIYVLLRASKKTHCPKDRIDEIFSAAIFDNLKQNRRELLNKVIVLAGDIGKENLGLDDTDRKVLISKISVVFHSAATVKFDEALKLAVAVNVKGTKYLLELCHQMTELKALIHISTAYSNCDKDEIDEIVYPPTVHINKIFQTVDSLDDEILQNITPQIIKSKPNTYTFTKALAEQVVVEQCGQIPTSIVRPSIVTASWKEPKPGWIDNLNGPTGVIAGAGKGILRTVYCKRDMITDIIPVDIVVNLLIATAWYTAINRLNNVTVYNCTSGIINPIKWKDVEEICKYYLRKHAFNDIVWYPGGSFKNYKFLHEISFVLFHDIPAYLYDTFALFIGKKPILVKVQAKIRKALKTLEFFTTHQYRFISDNTEKLYKTLSNVDKEEFNFNIEKLNWKKYLENYILGTRQFLLKEDPATIPNAKVYLNKMYRIHIFVQILFVILIFNFIFPRFDTYNYFYGHSSYLFKALMHYGFMGNNTFNNETNNNLLHNNNCI